MTEILFNILNFFKIDYRKFKRVFPVVLTLSFIYLFSTIVEDIPYLTDFQRRAEGSIHTSPFGSILLSLLCFKFNLKLFSTDVIFFTGPLNQIVSLIFLSFSSTVFCLSFSDLKSNFQNALVTFSIIANPLLLHAFYFTTDCAIFIIAFAFSLLATLEIPAKRINLIFGAILVFIIYGIAFIHLSSFIAAVFFIYLLKAQKNFQGAKQYLKESFYKLAAGVVIAQAFFSIYAKALIVIPVNIDGTFNSNLFNTISTIYRNVLSYFGYSKILLLSLLGFIIIFFVQYILESKDKLQSIKIIAISSLIIFSSPIIIQVILKYPIIEPQAFSAFSIILALSFYGFFKTIYKLFSFTKIIILVITFHFFYFSYGLTGMIRSQYHFNHEVASTVINQLYRNNFDKTNSILFTGYLGGPPSVENTRHRDPSFQAFHTGDLGGGLASAFFRYLGMNAQYIEGPLEENVELINLCGTKALVDSNNFKIFKNSKDQYLVAFRYSDCYKAIK